MKATRRGRVKRAKTPSVTPLPICGNFPSGSITAVLDAPGSDVTTSPLPRMFRSCLDPLKKDPKPPSVKGLKDINASGSSQYSKSQIIAVLNSGRTRKPMMVVDLRQESHGFLQLRTPLYGESTIAVGWFVERDWLNVGRGLPSIELDQRQRLSQAARTPALTVTWILTKTAEDGICTATPQVVHPVEPAITEQQVVEGLGLTYLRLPTTDHVRPRDSEVDEFVRIAAKLTRDTWLHFHCRGGDGRTTTFLVMHDTMCNAPAVAVDDIVRRQYLVGGANLDKPASPASYAYPFAIERRTFVRDFYRYVTAAKPGGYALTWSKWVAQQ
jgi:hypothetical protein